MDVEVEQLRRDPSRIAGLGASQILDHYEGIIRDLPQPPIIMGHSFGGAFTQLLLDRGLGAAGVAISSAPTKGIFKLPLATIRSATPILRNPLNRGKAVMLTPKQFHYSFTNTLSEEASLPVYERYAVPGVGRVLFEGALANLSPKSPFKIDYRRPGRAPLLLIGGGVDHVVPAAVVKINAGKYGKSAAITEYKEYPDRSHYILGQDGWERIADEALEWAVEHAGAAPR
jgi:pimeloyl-ACP methyl ester carboxylesterase